MHAKVPLLQLIIIYTPALQKSFQAGVNIITPQLDQREAYVQLVTLIIKCSST